MVTVIKHNTIIQAIDEAVDERRLNLILLPTEGCNFRCFYCYENFEIGLMKPSVIKGVKALLSNRAPELDTLEISWFGGEPLLAQKIIVDISNHIMELQKLHSQLQYAANITTNGFLLDVNTANHLSELGIRVYHISLDGDKDIHDFTRVTIDKKKTFDQIWSNLIAIHKSDLDVNILLRIHYMPQTWQKLESLINKINDHFGNDSRFQAYFKNISPLGGPNNNLITSIKSTEKHHIGKLLTNKLKVATFDIDGEYVCYASKLNSFVIRPNGDIGKCTVALYDEKNKIGSINEDGNMIINKDKLIPWISGLETLDVHQLACPYEIIKK